MVGLTPRPRQLGIASVLWIVLGVLIALGTYFQRAPRLAGSPAALLLVAIGVALVVFGLLLRGGAGWTRIPLTVLGAMSCIGLWPMLLVVPAIVLQYHQTSQEWLRLPPSPR